MQKLKLIAVVLCFLILVAPFYAQADMGLFNGRIWTGNPQQPWASALALKGEKIVAVGEDKTVRRTFMKGTQVIDLQGRFVMPGLNDSHIHFTGSSRSRFTVDLNGAKSLAEMQERIARFARENPDALWITGGGWEYSNMPGQRLPTKADLDSVVKDRPVSLSSYDGHTVWVNSQALEIGKVTAESRFTGFGELVVDEKTKEPTGVLKEGAMGLVTRHIPAPTREFNLLALRRGLKEASALGLTSIQNAGGSQSEVELYEELLKSSELSLRVTFAISVGPNTKQAEIDRIAALAKKYSGPRLRVGAVKLVVDGVIETYTAAMLTPYANKPDTAGSPAYTQEQLNNVVAMADKAGLQVYIHAIGDKGVRMALDSFAHAVKLNGKRDSRFRVEHIETIDAEDIPRFKKLGVIASMEPIHADPGTVDVWSANIGPDRTSRGFAWRALEKAGAILIFSSDHPASISLDPVRGLHNAVNRQTIEGEPPAGWQPQHRVSVATALAAYTVNGAFASFEEGAKGQLKPNMLADFVVLDANPFTVAPRDLHKIRVGMTVFDGKIVYRNF